MSVPERVILKAHRWKRARTTSRIVPTLLFLPLELSSVTALYPPVLKSSINVSDAHIHVIIRDTMLRSAHIFVTKAVYTNDVEKVLAPCVRTKRVFLLV